MRQRVAVSLESLMLVAVVGGMLGAGCQQTFVSPGRPDLYKAPHVYDLAVQLAEPGDLSASKPDLRGGDDLAKPDTDGGS